MWLHARGEISGEGWLYRNIDQELEINTIWKEILGQIWYLRDTNQDLTLLYTLSLL